MTVIPIIKKAQVYGIYNPATGKWSRGKCGPVWGNTPKTWGIGGLKNHLGQFVEREYNWRKPGNAEVTIVIRPAYKGCLIVDMGTNQEDPNLKIEDILRAKAEKESKHLGKNLPIVEREVVW